MQLSAADVHPEQAVVFRHPVRPLAEDRRHVADRLGDRLRAHIHHRDPLCALQSLTSVIGHLPTSGEEYHSLTDRAFTGGLPTSK